MKIKKIFGILLLICFFSISSICSTHAKKPAFKKVNCNEENMNVKPIVCYNLKLGQIIEKKWIDIKNIAALDKNLETIVIIDILNDGRLEQLKFEKKSGSPVLDEAAINAIVRCIPFPTLPEGMNSYQVGLLFSPNGLK